MCPFKVVFHERRKPGHQTVLFGYAGNDATHSAGQRKAAVRLRTKGKAVKELEMLLMCVAAIDDKWIVALGQSAQRDVVFHQSPDAILLERSLHLLSKSLANCSRINTPAVLQILR